MGISVGYFLVGESVGASDGVNVRRRVGFRVGANEGDPEIFTVGCLLATTGALVGASVGRDDGRLLPAVG